MFYLICRLRSHRGASILLPMVLTALVFSSGISFGRAGAPATPNNKSVRPELALQLGHSLSVTSLDYSPDGKLLASGAGDGTVKIWDALTRELIRTLPGHAAGVTDVEFAPVASPLGRGVLASASLDGSVRIWNAATGALLRRLPHKHRVYSLAFSPDGKLLLTGSGDRIAIAETNGAAILWDAESAKPLRTLVGDAGSIVAVAFSPDGKQAAGGGADGNIRLWNAAMGTLRLMLVRHRSFVESLAFAPDGKTLASAGGDRTVRLWDVEQGAQRAALEGLQGNVRSLTFSPDSRTLAGSNHKEALFWDASADLSQLSANITQLAANAVAFSPNGRTLAGGNAKTMQLLDLASRQLTTISTDRRRWTKTLAFSPDGKSLATAGGADALALLWDAESGAVKRRFTGSRHLERLSLSPDGKLLAGIDRKINDEEKEEILLWDARTEKLLRRWPGHRSAITALTFSPDSSVLATGGETGGENNREEIKLWNTQSGTLLKDWTGEAGWTAALAFSPDGKVLASANSGGEGEVRLWDTQSGTLRRALRGHEGRVSALAFAPGGKTLISGGQDNTVRLWDAGAGKPLRVLQAEGWVRSVAISPDGRLIAAGGKDNMIYLWDAVTGHLAHVLRGHESDVNAVAFSPDGRRLASGSDDTTTRLWSVVEKRELAQLLTAAPEEAQALGLAPETLWLVATPEGYYDCAEGADYLIKWRFDGKLQPFHHFEETYRRPDLIKKALRGERIAARPLLLTRVPPAIRIIAPFHEEEIAKTTVRVLIQAADDAVLTNSNFAFYVNGTLLPAEVAKPITVDGKPIVADGKPITVDGKPITVDGKPIMVDGKPITVDGKPITADGRGAARAHEASTQVSVEASGADMNQYPFHKLYVLDVPLPRGEEKIVLRAVVSDNEANKSDDAVVIRHLEKERIKGDLWLVSIGVSQYRNPLYNINYAAADAHGIAGVLDAQAGHNYARVNSEVLSDGQANVKNIRAALQKLKAAKPDDTVMVFLSGHGVQTGGKTYFAPWGVFVHNVAGTCLEWREIVESLSGLYAKKLLFTDACHSGAKLGERQATSAQLAEAVRREAGVVMLASSQGDEFSFEDKEVKQGTFSVALQEAFEGKADVDGDGNITLPEIMLYVPRRVSEKTKGLQNPQIVLVQDFNPQTVLAKTAGSFSVARHSLDGKMPMSQTEVGR